MTGNQTYVENTEEECCNLNNPGSFFKVCWYDPINQTEILIETFEEFCEDSIKGNYELVSKCYGADGVTEKSCIKSECEDNLCVTIFGEMNSVCDLSGSYLDVPTYCLLNTIPYDTTPCGDVNTPCTEFLCCYNHCINDTSQQVGVGGVCSNKIVGGVFKPYADTAEWCQAWCECSKSLVRLENPENLGEYYTIKDCCSF